MSQRYFQHNDKCCGPKGCTNEACKEYPSCVRCRRNVEENPWMLNHVRSQGDNNRPFNG